MSNDIATIRPGVGLGDLKFGATLQDVRNYLGEPGKIENPEPDSAVMWWNYPSQKIIVGFDENGATLLTHLMTKRATATLYGHKFIGLSSETALELAEPCGLGPHVSEEDPLGWEAVFDQANLEFRFDDDTLWLISWSVNVTKDDVIHWPE